MKMVKLINKFGMVSFVEENRKKEYIEKFGYKDPNAKKKAEKPSAEK